MKKMLLIATIVYQSFSLYAQTDKITVAVFPFGSTLPENKGRASQIQDLVLDILKNKSGIQLIDRSTDNQLIKEQDFQTRERSMAANGLVQQGKVLGAKHLLVGTVSNVAVEKRTSTGSNLLTKQLTTNVSYEASVSFALQLSDVETGKVIAQKAFNGSRGGLLSLGSIPGTGSTQEEAVVSAIRANRGLILAWINEAYPPEIKIIKIEERDKKGFPEIILVSGLDGTLQKGSRIVVNEVEMVDAGGQKLKRTKVIVELKVKEKQCDITICKVTDGEKVLEEKMNAGVKMECAIK